MEWKSVIEQDAARLARLALAEDGERDLTSLAVHAGRVTAQGRIEARSETVLAGCRYADAIAQLVKIKLEWMADDGQRVPASGIVGVLVGDLGSLLRAERSILNLLQRASGIATITRQFVDTVEGTGCTILHTRKTAPGLRVFDVQAVLQGGGSLHRLDLADTVMIKDNHWAALARSGTSLADAVQEARRLGAGAVQVEVETAEQLRLACAAGADRLLIDNQTPERLKTWGTHARELKPGIEIEATGGISLKNVRRYAEAGADFISVGALTHSVVAADLALEIEPGS
ncbi:MAG TPA: carboxylating nicotinate-nucleotide diphosphorylase [Gemmatimonadales bacterium]|nr:carboxylating nicotinate-nucleotide diphosphorylase [Gemmatimonadales bacterium]